MDLTRVLERCRYFGAMLALAATYQWTAADELAVADSDEPQPLVVTARGGGDALPAPPSAVGNELVVRTDDSHIVAATDNAEHSASGTLSGVANTQRKAPVSAIIIDPAVEQTAARAQSSAAQPRTYPRNNMFSGGPRRPVGLQTTPQRT